MLIQTYEGKTILEWSLLAKEQRQRIAQLEAEVARLTEELHTVKVERGRNAMSHMNEYHRAEKWKQEAQWAARIVLLPMVFNSINKESQDRAERILNDV